MLPPFAGNPARREGSVGSEYVTEGPLPTGADGVTNVVDVRRSAPTAGDRSDSGTETATAEVRWF